MKKCLSTILAIFLSFFLFATPSFAVSPDPLSGFSEEWRQAFNAAEDLGVEFTNVNNLGFSEDQMDNLMKFDSIDEFLEFITQSKHVDIEVDIAKDIPVSQSSLTHSASLLRAADTRITKEISRNHPTEALLWENILVSYDMFESYGHRFMRNVSVEDGWFTGVTLAVSYTFIYGEFSGINVIYPDAMGIGLGIADAHGTMFVGAEIFGLQLGVTVPYTMSIGFAA